MLPLVVDHANPVLEGKVPAFSMVELLQKLNGPPSSMMGGFNEMETPMVSAAEQVVPIAVTVVQDGILCGGRKSVGACPGVRKRGTGSCCKGDGAAIGRICSQVH